jgi:hypothetical protein
VDIKARAKVRVAKAEARDSMASLKAIALAKD